MSGSLPLSVPPFPLPFGENKGVFLILGFALYNRGQQMVSIKGQMVNIADFAGQSATATVLCYCGTEATSDDT